MAARKARELINLMAAAPEQHPGKNMNVSRSAYAPCEGAATGLGRKQQVPKVSTSHGCRMPSHQLRVSTSTFASRKDNKHTPPLFIEPALLGIEPNTGYVASPAHLPSSLSRETVTCLILCSTAVMAVQLEIRALVLKISPVRTSSLFVMDLVHSSFVLRLYDLQHPHSEGAVQSEELRQAHDYSLGCMRLLHARCSISCSSFHGRSLTFSGFSLHLVLLFPAATPFDRPFRALSPLRELSSHGPCQLSQLWNGS